MVVNDGIMLFSLRWSRKYTFKSSRVNVYGLDTPTKSIFYALFGQKWPFCYEENAARYFVRVYMSLGMSWHSNDPQTPKIDIFYCFSVQQIRSSIFCRHVKRIWEWNVAWDKLTPVSLLAFRRRHTSSVTWWPLKGYAYLPFNIRPSFEQNSLYFNKSS